MSLVWSSMFTWSNEGVTFLLFLVGLYVLCLRLSRYLRRFMGSVTDVGLARFAVFQVVFLAVWSVIFKDLLPSFVRQPTGPLYHGWSQTFAMTAQDIGTVLAMVGLVVLVVRFLETNRREVHHV